MTEVRVRDCPVYGAVLSEFLHSQFAPKSVPHVQHDYFSSFNQSDHRFLALWLPSSLLKAPCILFSMVVT